MLAINQRLRATAAELEESRAQLIAELHTIESQAQRLRLLNQLSQAAAGTLDLDRLLQLVVQDVPEALGCARCGVVRYDAPANEMVVLAAHRTDGGPVRGVGHRRRVSESQAGQVLLHQAPLVMQDTRGSRLPDASRRAEDGILSFASVPIVVDERPWGVLNAGYTEPGVVTPDLVEFLTQLAAHLAIAIHNAELFGQLQAASQIQAELAAIVESSQDAIVGRTVDGIITSWNLAAESLFGYTAAEMLGQPLARLAPPDRIAEVEAAQAATRRGERPALLETVRLRKGGVPVPVSVSVSPVRTRDGRIIGGAASYRDITERQRAHEELQASHRQLQQALANLEAAHTQLQAAQEQVIQQERLRALGEMASGIAHDFNNALAPIVGFSELLLVAPEPFPDPVKARTYLTVIHTAAEDAARVVSRLREFYRSREPAERHLPVDLAAVVTAALMLTQPKWKDQAQAHGATIAIKTDLPRTPRIAGDEAELREALTNLIFNAADAMPVGGTITIRTRAVRDPVGAGVVLEVTDTGTGMPEVVRRRCVEPFFTTKGQHGTGLGLAMVYGIAQRHHATLEIESTPGRGTAVRLRFPVASPTARGGRAASATAAAPRSLHVLVVDDDPRLRDVVEAVLTGAGHRVTLATNGREAWTRFQARRRPAAEPASAVEPGAPPDEAPFDVVLTDRAMPEMHGDELAAAIKTVAPHVPVVLLTGFGEFMLDADERPPGVDLVLPKPFHAATLREALPRVVDQLSR